MGRAGNFIEKAELMCVGGHLEACLTRTGKVRDWAGWLSHVSSAVRDGKK